MSSPSSSPPPGSEALARLLREHHLTGDLPLPELHAAVRHFCDGVHRCKLRPEQMLVIVKDLWASMPEPRPRGHLQDPRELLDRIVSLCISEYFDQMRPAAERDLSSS